MYHPLYCDCVTQTGRLSYFSSEYGPSVGHSAEM
ncbi:hypothetical protein YPPY66_1923, partial [Yersinia pestis PY-66]